MLGIYRFRIIGNSIYDSGSNGISAFSVRDIIIANNIVEASGEKGILLGLCEQFAISGNTVIRSADDGIQVFSSSENASISHIGTISGNVVVGNGNTGIEQRGHCVSICGNVVCNNSFHGLAVGGHNDSAVGNVVAGNGAGARLAASNIYSTSPLCSFVGNMTRETDIASSGRAAAASASSITFETGKYINTNNVYSCYRVIIVEGTATGAIGTITGFNGSTGVAAIGQGWNPPSPSPDSTSKYIIVPQSYRTDYGAFVQECKDTMFTANDLAISGQTAHLYINNDVTAHIHANKTSNSAIIIFGTDSDKQPGSDHMGGLLIVTPTFLFSSGSITVTFDRAFNSGDHLPFVVVSLTDLSGSWTQPAGCKVSALPHSAFTIDYNNNGNLSVGYSYGISYVVIDK